MRTSWGIILLLLLAIPWDAWAQFATVRGRILDAGDGLPLPGAAVVLANRADGRQVGTATNAQGAFVFNRLRPGRYILEASFVGFSPHTDTLDLDFGDQQTLTLRLVAEEAAMEEVVVETSRTEAPAEAIAGQYTIRPSMLARVPMPDVSADLAAYLLTLPGFVSTGDRGGQLFVRGGTATQNLVLIDGMPVYQPFHIVGFYSAFPADIVSYADVYAGGFGARYGGRISSVIDVATRNGNKERVVGGASVAPFLSAVRLEVPIQPGKVSVLASARESIIERVAPNVLGQDLPFRFGDRFVKFHAFLNNTSSFSATALQTFDEGNISSSAEAEGGQRSSWRNGAFGIRYIYLPPEYPAMTQLNIYSSRLTSRFSPVAGQVRDAEVSSAHVEMLFLYLLGDTQFNMGLFVTSSRHAYDVGTRENPVESHLTHGGGFFDTQLKLSDEVDLEAGLRADLFSTSLGVTLGPRARARWQPGGTFGRRQFSMAWGLYHQQIVGLNDEQNVSNVFTIWAPVPDNTPAPQAMHLIVGWRERLWAGIEFTLEGYAKQLTNITFPRLSNLLGGVAAYNLVDGKVRGVDARLEVIRPAFYANVNYSLASVTYTTRRVIPFLGLPIESLGGFQAINEPFHPSHDRRHQINALTQVAWRDYRFSLRWQYGSGLPFTQVEGYYEALNIKGPQDRDFHTRVGPTLVARADPFQARLPSYHRLDVSAERVFTSKRVNTTLQAGVINIYDRANVFDYNFFSGHRVNQLPLIPSVGVKVEVR